MRRCPTRAMAWLFNPAQENSEIQARHFDELARVLGVKLDHLGAKTKSCGCGPLHLTAWTEWRLRITFRPNRRLHRCTSIGPVSYTGLNRSRGRLLGAAEADLISWRMGASCLEMRG
jgi:hypothetical protein